MFSRLEYVRDRDSLKSARSFARVGRFFYRPTAKMLIGSGHQAVSVGRCICHHLNCTRFLDPICPSQPFSRIVPVLPFLL